MKEILQKCIDDIAQKKIVGEEIYRFLGTYYYDLLDITEEKLADDYECDENDDNTYPEELTKPLEERSSGVLEGLKHLVEKGYDLNAGKGFNPLMMAVSAADASMTSFLIRNGADANYWPDMEDVPADIRQNYYLEEIDIAYFNENETCAKQYTKALLETAKVLLSEGNTGSYFGYCLEADAEKRKISIQGPQYLY